MKKVLWMIFMTFMVLNVNAQKSISSDEVITSNIQYKNGKDTYIKERCKLDICYDKSKKKLTCSSVVSRRRIDQWTKRDSRTA